VTTPQNAIAEREDEGAGPTPNDPDGAGNSLAFPDGVVTRNTGAGHTGGMLALVPSDDDLDNLAIDGGEDPAELHLTLAYLGDDMSQLTPEQMAALHQMAGDLAENVASGDGPSPQGQIFGHAHFNPAGDDPCATYLAEGAGFPELNDAAVRIGQHVLGDKMADQHAIFSPHITAAYGKTPAALNYTGPVNFDRLRVALGDNQTDYPLYAPEMDSMGDPDSATAAATATDDAPAVPIPAFDDGIPVTLPVVIVEGLETSDHRYIEPGALGHRALPLPILAQTVNGGEGHKGAEVVGKITELTRVPGPDVIDKETGQPFPPGSFVWQGKGELNPSAGATELAQRGYLTGNSADLSDMSAEYEYTDPAGNELPGDGERLVVSGGKIAATTLVAIPAFAQAYIQVDGQEMTPAADNTALAASAWRSAEVGDECLMCELLAAGPADEWDDDGYEFAAAPDAAKRARALKKGLAMPPAPGQPAGQASYPVENADDLANAIRAVGRGSGNHNAIRVHIMKAAKKLGLSSKIPDNWAPDGSLKAVAASAYDDKVLPAYYFADPQLDGPTPLTVDDDGHVFGHLATWGTCHIGFAGQCVTPPHSTSDYAYFATGAVRVRDADGGELHTQAVGHITLGTGHASMSLAAKPAAEHYDNTGSVVADIAAGEDAHGIWIAGRARPGIDVEQLRASALSGDWRKINGRLELVAALGVNVPGFPIPRARVASGEQVALVAAGAVTSVHANTSGAVKNDDLAETLGQKVIEFLQANLPGVSGPDLGLDTGGDQVGSSDLADRAGALAELGLDENSQRSAALREIAFAQLEDATPFV
jgi:hypothetical protein